MESLVLENCRPGPCRGTTRPESIFLMNAMCSPPVIMELTGGESAMTGLRKGGFLLCLHDLFLDIFCLSCYYPFSFVQKFFFFYLWVDMRVNLFWERCRFPFVDLPILLRWGASVRSLKNLVANGVTFRTGIWGNNAVDKCISGVLIYCLVEQAIITNSSLVLNGLAFL